MRLRPVVLLGVQPALAQVPPKHLGSIGNPLRPAARRRAGNRPAYPVPMMVASSLSIIVL
jgi:hypothetical protein